MKFLFACGGTAGHINPAISVAQYIKSQHPEAEILFVGNPNGMEARLVPKAGFAFKGVKILGFQRQINWHNIKNNAKAVALLMTASSKAGKIIKDFNPDIVVGTGGYVSGPVLRKAHKMGYKTVTHEQNAFPGVTTKLLTRYADKVLLAFEKAVDYLPKGCEYIVTGNPVREDIIFADRKKSREKLGVADKFCLLTYGGSLGAQRVNEAVADVIAWHYKAGNIHHIHATGSYGVELLPRLLKEKGVDLSGNKNIDIREYIDDMADCMAAADLVVCRAGAITLSELQAAGRASILIPSPNVAENHQYHNAMVLVNNGAAEIIEEKYLTGKILCDKIAEIVNDRQRLERFSNNAENIAGIDANKRIHNEINSLIK